MGIAKQYFSTVYKMFLIRNTCTKLHSLLRAMGGSIRNNLLKSLFLETEIDRE